MEKKVNGFVGRHLPVSDGNRIYYTTMLGIIGCLEKNQEINYGKFLHKKG